MLCLVDLAVCDRPECRSGVCERADDAMLAICWECGAVESKGVVAGICVACVASAAPPTRKREE